MFQGCEHLAQNGTTLQGCKRLLQPGSFSIWKGLVNIFVHAKPVSSYFYTCSFSGLQNWLWKRYLAIHYYEAQTCRDGIYVHDFMIADSWSFVSTAVYS